MKIPADCLIINSTDLETDESSLTGEPESFHKSALTDDTLQHNVDPFLFSQTLIVSGIGHALVCTVGRHTRSGRAEEKLNIEAEATPLQQKLETIANEIGKIGTLCAMLTFIVMTVKYIFTTLMDDNQNLIFKDTVGEILNYFIIAITVVVVAIPEGLPLAVTISLAFSVMKMKKENNLVRRLEASEIMGGAQEICTDKTGTLTLNRMTVQEVYICDTVAATVPEAMDKDLIN